jgi:futalosine hydrolase
MSILVAAATLFEVAPMIKRRAPEHSVDAVGASGMLLKLTDVDVLVTGVGELQCAAHVSRVLARERYDLIVQAGIAGSFSADLPKLSVVRVASEICADLGAEDNGGFLHISDMGLLDPNQFPFRDGELQAPDVKIEALSTLFPARSVTVNRVLSEERSIRWVSERFDPHVVNMEGAGLFYSALVAGVPFVSVRAISDMVGPRDRSKWDIPGAIHALDAVLESVVVECGPQFSL